MYRTLRHRGFRLLVIGQTASTVGDGVYAVALPWYVLDHGGNALLLATVLAAYGVPRTVMVAAGGHAADRWGAWTVMMIADAVRAVALTALAVTALVADPRAALLVPVAVVLGAGEGLFLPGSFAIIPSLLPSEELQAGNALSSGGGQLAALVGPAVGGGIVALAGSSTAFAVDTVTFLISAGTLAALARHRRAAGGARTVAAHDERADDAPTVLAMIRRHRVLQIVLITTLAANLGSGALGEVALPAWAHGSLRSGAGGYGALIAALGVGSLVGTLLAGRARPRRPAAIAGVAFLAEAAAFAAVPWSGSAILAGGTLAVAGLGNGFGNLLTITVFQQWVPPAMMGRLMGVVLLCSFGIFPVSVWLGGLVVHGWGAAAVFPLAGAVLAVAIGVSLTWREWRDFGMRSAPQVPGGQSAVA